MLHCAAPVCGSKKPSDAGLSGDPICCPSRSRSRHRHSRRNAACGTLNRYRQVLFMRSQSAAVGKLILPASLLGRDMGGSCQRDRPPPPTPSSPGFSRRQNPLRIRHKPRSPLMSSFQWHTSALAKTPLLCPTVAPVEDVDLLGVPNSRSIQTGDLSRHVAGVSSTSRAILSPPGQKTCPRKRILQTIALGLYFGLSLDQAHTLRQTLTPRSWDAAGQEHDMISRCGTHPCRPHT